MKHYPLPLKHLEIILFPVWGMILMSVPILFLVGGYFAGDITLFKPIALKHKLSDVSSIIQLTIGACIMLGPLHRRLFGAVALLLTMMVFMLGWYFGQTMDREIYTPLLPLVGILYSCGLQGIPTLYLLITGISWRGPPIHVA